MSKEESKFKVGDLVRYKAMTGVSWRSGLGCGIIICVQSALTTSDEASPLYRVYWSSKNVIYAHIGERLEKMS